jgi:AAA ATPase domain
VGPDERVVGAVDDDQLRPRDTVVQHPPVVDRYPRSIPRPPPEGYILRMGIGGAASPSAAFVGRSAELGELRAALTEALGGSSRAVLITGEPGIGKTALVVRLAAEAQALGVPVRWGGGSESEGAPAFWPWIQIVREQPLRSDP